MNDRESAFQNLQSLEREQIWRFEIEHETSETPLVSPRTPLRTSSLVFQAYPLWSCITLDAQKFVHRLLPCTCNGHKWMVLLILFKSSPPLLSTARCKSSSWKQLQGEDLVPKVRNDRGKFVEHPPRLLLSPTSHRWSLMTELGSICHTLEQFHP